MAGSQQYIGTPNGVVICLDSLANAEFIGRLYHFYQKEPVNFIGVGQMFLAMEELFDCLQFPRATTIGRSFQGNQESTHTPTRRIEMKKVVTDQELSNRHGDLGTFIIRVQHRQNSSWQGRVTWLEEDKTLNFRSTWELLKLVEDAVDSMDPTHNTVPDWFVESQE